MPQLQFSNNWNHKLDCDVFSTIRLRNDRKYFAGAELEVILKQGNRSTNKGMHRILGIRYVTLNELDGYTCLLDTGYPLAETQKIIKTMYVNAAPAINWSKQHLVIILLKKEGRDNQPTLFQEP